MHFESIFQKYFQNLSHEKHGLVLTRVGSGSYVYRVLQGGHSHGNQGIQGKVKRKFDEKSEKSQGM